MLNESLISLVLIKDDQKFINNKLKYLYNTLEINIFGIEEKKSEENDYRKLVYHKSVYDDCFEGDLKFSKDALNSNKRFDLIYNHDDICFYVFNKNVYKLLDNEHIKRKNLLKNDFVPFLINKSYKKILRKLLYGSRKDIEENSEENEDFNCLNNKNNVDIMALVLDNEENYA